VVAQVEPLLSDKEVVALSVDTLQELFYDRMIGTIFSNFSNIVIIRERVESSLRNRKIAHVSSRTTIVKKLSNEL